jgi:hypothetical protein
MAPSNSLIPTIITSFLFGVRVPNAAMAEGNTCFDEHLAVFARALDTL